MSISMQSPPALQTQPTAEAIQPPASQQPTVSIIVPAYCKTAPTLAALLETLGRLAVTVNFERTEVLVQDDATPDVDLQKIIGFPPFKTERNETNLGFIRNVNRAAKRAKGDYLCLLNQDCKPLVTDWLDRMLTLATTIPNVGIVGPKLVFPDGSIQSCGGIFDGNKNPWHRFLGWKDATDWRVNTTEPVSWITGACILIRRDDFWKCGGLDDVHYIEGYFDDVDLCLQVSCDLHKDIWYSAESLMEHAAGSTGGSKWFQHNLLAFHRKWDDKITPDTPIIHAPW